MASAKEGVPIFIWDVIQLKIFIWIFLFFPYVLYNFKELSKENH